MGEGNRRSQAKEHRQRLSKQPCGQSDQSNLFGEVGVSTVDVVSCILAPNTPCPNLQDEVKLVDYGGDLIEVAFEVSIIGFVGESGTELLRNVYRISEVRGHAIHGIVTQVNPEWGEFYVTING